METTANKQPIVSILTPVYNSWEYLADCAAGVYAQKDVGGTTWEWLIGINGHGADGGPAAVAAAAVAAAAPPGCTVRMLNLPDARGKVEAMNALVAAADPVATWIAVLDCDDVWAPNKLAAQLEAVAPTGPAAGATVIGTHCLYFGDMLCSGPRLPPGWIPSDAWKRGNPLINSSVLLRREVARWEDRFGLDDYDLWIRLSLAGCRMYNLLEPLTYHRIHAASAFNGKGRQDVEGLRNFYQAI